jgi:asparagine synthase (glutamine-hydrolysing)
MCGFTGFLNLNGGIDSTHAQHLLHSMANEIIHRGPDSYGFWVEPAVGVGLAHRRLAIIDLSPAGSQPMASNSGRYVLAFNGEIYNHKLLRQALEKQGRLSAPWRGHSDTETLLACIEVWGLEYTLKQANGMFAVALWDRELNNLKLVRDRLGEKPLYFGWQGNGRAAAFLFGSELSALKRHPAFEHEINRNSLNCYLRNSCIGGENSIYKGINKLLPGHLLSVSSAAPEPEIRTWWSSEEVARQGIIHPFTGTPQQAVNELEGLLKSAVGQQMMADVPLGAFLSGGIDSSTVVALMQAQSSNPVRTFSIGFHEAGYDEAKHAKAVANHLGTNHTELYVTSKETLDLIPKIPKLYSEPFADSSQIPTYLVSHLARQSVKVTLSGDAGDELFCGYNRYQLTSKLWRKVSRLPIPMRKLAAGIITTVPPYAWNKLGKHLSISHIGDKLHKGAAILESRTLAEFYQGMVSHWSQPASILVGTSENAALLSGTVNDIQGLSDVECLMALDMMNYLPDDILVKVDRAAMSVGLETRVPFLDHRLVEFAWSLPLDYKLRMGETKWALRQVLYRHVPRQLFERPKMGFSVPIDEWLRGPLRDWAETLLTESRLREEGFFNPVPIRKKWKEHLSGDHNWQHQLWSVLMFQAWLKS